MNLVDLMEEGADSMTFPKKRVSHSSTKSRSRSIRDRSDAQLSHEMTQIKSGVVGDKVLLML